MGGDGALWPNTARVGNTDCETPAVERLSHPELSFVTNSVDVAIMLRSPMAAALCVEVDLLRFGGEEEDVPHAAQAVGELYKRLHSTLAPHTQDTARQVHLDVALRGGDCVFPLQERLDFPNLYEGLVNFGEADALLPVSLFLRVPLHSTEYAPRRLAEWLVCRVEHFPINF